MTSVAALHFKEWRVQSWKVLVGFIILPVYFFSILHEPSHRNSQTAMILIALLSALFGAESVAEERRSGAWEFLTALPVRPRFLYLVKYVVGLAGLLMSVGGALFAARILLPISAFMTLEIAFMLGLAVVGHALSFLVSATTQSAAKGWGAAGAVGLAATLTVNPKTAQIVPVEFGHLLFMALAAVFLFAFYRCILSNRLFAPLPDHPEFALINSDIRRATPMLALGGGAAYLLQNWFPGQTRLLPYFGLALWLGVSQVASNREDGNLSWLYSLPLPPAKVLQAKHLAGFFLLLPLCFLVMLTTAPSLGAAIIACFLLFLAYGIAFIVAAFTSSRLFALTVILVGGYAITVSPLLILLVPILAPLFFFTPDLILDLKCIWWPEKEHARTRTSPWSPAALPLLGLLMIPTVMAWDDWRCYLASDEAEIIPVTEHWPEITGLDILLQDTALFVRTREERIEARSTIEPTRIIISMPFSNDRWRELEATIAGLNVAPPKRDLWKTPGRMEVMQLPPLILRDRMTVSDDGYIFKARANPFSLSGAPQPAMVIQDPKGGFNWRSSWAAAKSLAVVPFPEETLDCPGRIYRAMAIDKARDRVFLVGDAGLSMVALDALRKYEPTERILEHHPPIRIEVETMPAADSFQFWRGGRGVVIDQGSDTLVLR